jgi:hypothetical protein
MGHRLSACVGYAGAEATLFEDESHRLLAIKACATQNFTE